MRVEGESLEREIKFETELVIKEKEESKIPEKASSKTFLFSTNKVIQVQQFLGSMSFLNKAPKRIWEHLLPRV